MSPSIRILLIALPLLATGCDSLFYVEAETDEVCKTERKLSFPASIPIPGTVSRTMEFPVGDIIGTIPTGSTEAQLRMRLFELTTTDVDLSGVEKASVSLRLEGQSAPMKLLEYKRPANQTATQKLTATGSGVLDLNELIRQENLELTFEASGTLPQRDWNGDLRVCAGLWLKTDVLDLIF
ncbi:hypothetical protein [Hyalangium versicolor]|uniref:hypothetical protein n=1 Tax=Hyalangium versicolor TaxID=2861190 RepID=UPI001CCB131C|nr:hypothetical protein [Hyalangium versicolor]